ncbi:MAG: hypothetical protein EOO01_38475, partial [Chitinophagaceae bacterium]
MSKNLKKFIEENRHSFDDEQPSETNWNRISKTVPALQEKRSAVKKIYRWTAAAAVFLVAIACYYLFMPREGSGSRPLARDPKPAQFSKDRVNDVNSIDPEYAAKAAPIYQQIERSQEELKNLSAGQPELYDQFTQD